MEASGSYCTSGTIVNNPAKSIFIQVDVPYATTIITFNLNFKNLSSNVMKVSFKYYDDISKR